MADKEKPLPKPPSTLFGKRTGPVEQNEGGLLADRMAEAAALGKLDEFLKKELPESEQAQALARMMMGMTGMRAPGVAPSDQNREKSPESAPSAGASSPLPPEDVMKAIQDGDVQGLMDLLRKEHQKRNPGSELKTAPVQEAPLAQPTGSATIDKELIDEMIRIASDNSVTLDWIILRAIRVYVEEYRKTGKL